MHWKLPNAKDKLRPKYMLSGITELVTDSEGSIPLMSGHVGQVGSSDTTCNCYSVGVRFEPRPSRLKSSEVFLSTFWQTRTVTTSNESVVKDTVKQGCTNPRCKVVVATKFYKFAPNICGFSVPYEPWFMSHFWRPQL
jgi:hypothetical protein